MPAMIVYNNSTTTPVDVDIQIKLDDDDITQGCCKL